VGEHIASIFRVEKIRSAKISKQAGGKLAGFCSTYFFYPEDGGDMFLRNVG
jgi:hypothetical protein